MQIKIIWTGKTKNSPIRSLTTDYLARIRAMVSCDVVEIRNLSKARGLRGSELIMAEGAEILRFLPDTGCTVVLDERGKQFSSEELAGWFESEQMKGTREVWFVVGGHAGMDSRVAGRAHFKLSLGKMTWTHEMCRALLLEQIYRAFSIMRKIPYHK